MKYLVTGGAGFIGSTLVHRLCSKGHHVIVIDDLSSGKRGFLPDNVLIEFVEAKVQDLDIAAIAEIDGIFHLGAQASVPLSIDNFYDSSANNLLSTLKVFDWARNQDVPVVYATSSAVYGELPFGDDGTEAVELGSPYAVDKYVMEKYAHTCHEHYQLSSVGLRFFNVYGPKQDASNPYSGVISIFIDRLLKGQSVIVNGGYQTRDFIFIDDVVDTLCRAMSHASDQRCCEVLNLGTDVSVTIDDLLASIASEIGIEPDVEYRDLPAGDPAVSLGTSKRVAQLLNIDHQQFTPLAEGIKRTIAYEKKQGSGYEERP